MSATGSTCRKLKRFRDGFDDRKGSATLQYSDLDQQTAWHSFYAAEWVYYEMGESIYLSHKCSVSTQLGLLSVDADLQVCHSVKPIVTTSTHGLYDQQQQTSIILWWTFKLAQVDYP